MGHMNCDELILKIGIGGAFVNKPTNVMLLGDIITRVIERSLSVHRLLLC